ncbi:hypothetical protein NLJ89_g858 [Agrocybe chaxingu]|uniref:Meiotically up-regulated protein Msb1/Mug8 domain-containing protein n=1 Tax=Agrocybe chaxingu TaxID=84603 RepID=A0A9W8TG28_9AGAR|nr:hypothetical protein NLJ89_g858 [Agrocybe chaxingu]
MHSFLSKVFGRKKDDRDASPPTLAPGELLDGKFEAVSPNVSPSAANFLELDQKTNGKDKERGRDAGLPLFKANKSRPSSPEVNTRKLDTLPHLSLNFADLKAQSAYFFDTDPDAHILLTDAVIGQRRLNPMEALVLIRACSRAIVARGLETLGIMHPHWYSASPDIQRRLISQFIHSLDAHSPATALSAVSPSPISNFESELNFTRDPHDVAAVLRWGLRHVQLEGDSFGTDDGWYKAFLDAEAAADYPPKAFSEILAPKLPPAHLELLTATLEIVSSLAPLAEANSTSGSKLSKIFGLWLLTARRVEEKDDWKTFYARWERTGRMLEHLFLSRIRDESTDQRMPIRLLELVRKYPYTQGLSPPTTDLQLLPRPRFTTSVHDALFVRIEIELASFRRKPKSRIHPVDLLADAFSTKVEDGEYAEVWAKITAASKGGDHPSSLSNFFADETIRFLSLVPDKRKEKEEVKSPTFSLLPSSASPRKRSFSVTEADKPAPLATQHTKPATDPTPITTPISPLAIGSDWAQFSTSGFIDVSPGIPPLASTLFDTDLEKTRAKAPAVEPASSPRKSTASSTTTTQAEPEPQVVVRATNLHVVQLDEAFIDFWSDALLDPISADWPTFIVCKFKSTLVPELTYGPLEVEAGQHRKTLKWLVLEQVYTLRPPPPPPPPCGNTGDAGPRERQAFVACTVDLREEAIQFLEFDLEDGIQLVGEMGELIEEEDAKPAKGRQSLDASRKDKGKAKKDESKPKEVKPKEEAKPKEEVKAKEESAKEGVSTTAVAAIATSAVAAGAAAAVLAATSSEEPEVPKTEEAEAEKIVEVEGPVGEVKQDAVAEVVTTVDETIPTQEIPVVDEVDKAPAVEVTSIPETPAVSAEAPAPDVEPTSEVAPPVEPEVVVPAEDAKPVPETVPPTEAEVPLVEEVKAVPEAVPVEEVKAVPEVPVAVEVPVEGVKPAVEIAVEEVPASIPVQLQEAIESDHVVPESAIEETPAVAGETAPAFDEEAPASVGAEAKDIVELAVVSEPAVLEEVPAPVATEHAEVAAVPEIAREASADEPAPIDEPAAAPLADEIPAPIEAEVQPAVAIPATAEVPTGTPVVEEFAVAEVPPVVEEDAAIVEAPVQEAEPVPVVAEVEEVAPIAAVEEQAEVQPETPPVAEAPAPEAAVNGEEVSLVKAEEVVIPSVVDGSSAAPVDSAPTRELVIQEATAVEAEPLVAEKAAKELPHTVEEVAQVESEPVPAPDAEAPAADATMSDITDQGELDIDNTASDSIPESTAPSVPEAIAEVKGREEQEGDVVLTSADAAPGIVETKVDEIVAPGPSILEAQVVKSVEPEVDVAPVLVEDVRPVPVAVEEYAQVPSEPEVQPVAEVEAPEASVREVSVDIDVEEKEPLVAPAVVEETPAPIDDAVVSEPRAEEETNDVAPAAAVLVEEHAAASAVETGGQIPIEPAEAQFSEGTGIVNGEDFVLFSAAAEIKFDIVVSEVMQESATGLVTEVAPQVVEEPPLTPVIVEEDAHVPVEAAPHSVSEKVEQDVSAPAPAEETSPPTDTRPDELHELEVSAPESTAEVITEAFTDAQDVSTTTDTKKVQGQLDVQPTIEPEAPALEASPVTGADVASGTTGEDVEPAPALPKEEIQPAAVPQTAQEDVAKPAVEEYTSAPTPLSVEASSTPLPVQEAVERQIPTSVDTEVTTAEEPAPALELEHAAVLDVADLEIVEEKADDVAQPTLQAATEPEIVSEVDAAPAPEVVTDTDGFSNADSVLEGNKGPLAEEVAIEVLPEGKGDEVISATVAEDESVANEPVAAEGIAEERVLLEQEAFAPSEPYAQIVIEEIKPPVVDDEDEPTETTPEVVASLPTVDEGDAVVVANGVENAIPAEAELSASADIMTSAIPEPHEDNASGSTDTEVSIRKEGVVPDDTLAVEPQVAVEGPSQAAGETDATVPEALASVEEPTPQDITADTVGTTTVIDVEQSTLAEAGEVFEAEDTPQELPQVVKPEIQAIAIDEHATLTLSEDNDQVAEPQPEIEAHSTTIEEAAPYSAPTGKVEVSSTISAEPETDVVEPAISSAAQAQAEPETAPILERAAPTQNEPEIVTEDSSKADPQVDEAAPPATVDTRHPEAAQVSITEAADQGTSPLVEEESVVPHAPVVDDSGAVGEKEVANETSAGERTTVPEVAQEPSTDIAAVESDTAVFSQPQTVDEPIPLVAPVATTDVTASVVEDPALDTPDVPIEKHAASADVAEPAADESIGDRLVAEPAGVSLADADAAPAIIEADTALTATSDEVTLAVEEPAQEISVGDEGKEVGQEAPPVLDETAGQPPILEAPVAVVAESADEEATPAADNQPFPVLDVPPKAVDEAVAALEEHIEEPAAEPSLPTVEDPAATQPIPEQDTETEEPASVVEEPTVVAEEVSIAAEDAAPIVDQIHSSHNKPQEPTHEETVPAETTTPEERESRTATHIAEPIPQVIEELPSTTDEPSQTTEEPSPVVEIPASIPEEVKGSQEDREEATPAVEEPKTPVEDAPPANEITSVIDDVSPAVLESSAVEPPSLPADVPIPTVEEPQAASGPNAILEQPGSKVEESVSAAEVDQVEVKETTQLDHESKPEAEEDIHAATSTPLAAAEESTSAVEGLASEVAPAVEESASVLEEPGPAVEALPQIIEVTAPVSDQPTSAVEETLVGEEVDSHKSVTSVELEAATTGPAATTGDSIVPSSEGSTVEEAAAKESVLAQEDSPVPEAEPEAVAIGEPAVAEETPAYDDPKLAQEQTISEEPTTEQTEKLAEEPASVIPSAADAAILKDEFVVQEPVVAPQLEPAEEPSQVSDEQVSTTEQAKPSLSELALGVEDSAKTTTVPEVTAVASEAPAPSTTLDQNASVEKTKADEEPATIVEQSPALEDPEIVGTAPVVVEKLGEDEPVAVIQGSVKTDEFAEEAINGEPSAVAQPTKAIDETTPTPQSTVVSSEPRIEPVSISSDDSADKLVDLPPSAAKDRELPPAPESVVLSGSTPGPEVALSTSEPAALEKALDEIVSSVSGTEVLNGNGHHHVPSEDNKAAIAEDTQAPTAANGQAAVEDAPVVLDSAILETVKDVDVPPANANEYLATAADTPPISKVETVSATTEPETTEKDD